MKKVISAETLYRFALHPKAPLCKGGWMPEGQTGGLCSRNCRIPIGFRQNRNILPHNPSVSFADSSLYTREPGALPRQRVFRHAEKQCVSRGVKKRCIRCIRCITGPGTGTECRACVQLCLSRTGKKMYQVYQMYQTVGPWGTAGEVHISACCKMNDNLLKCI